MKLTSKILVGTLLTLGAFSAFAAEEEVVFADVGYTDANSETYIPWQDFKNHPEDVRTFEMLYRRISGHETTDGGQSFYDYALTKEEFEKANYDTLSNWDKMRYNNTVYDNSMEIVSKSLTKAEWKITDQAAIDGAEKRILDLANQGYPFAKYVRLNILVGKELKTCETNKSPARCRRSIELNDDIVEGYEEVLKYDVTYSVLMEYLDYLQRFSRKNSNAVELKKAAEAKYLPIFTERRELLRNLRLDKLQG